MAPTPAKYDLKLTSTAKKTTAAIYQKIKDIIPEAEWDYYAPYVHKINQLKKKKKAVILAHNYMTPDIFHTVADFAGDSLQLAVEASRTEADIIIQCGVHFMAETSKLLNPEKTVIIPDMKAGCSLAASITGADVKLMREKYPGVPIVTYVNTSADVKAESDICCTSSNAVAIVEAMDSNTVIMIPDQFLARNVAKQTSKKIITWAGACEVHERFTPAEIRAYRAANPGIAVLAHPECPPEVVAEADFSGSTSAMIAKVKEDKLARVLMVTECSMSDNVVAEVPETEFVRPCNLCPHMKRISLPKILAALEAIGKPELAELEVAIEPELAERARAAVERMIEHNKSH